MKFTFLSDNRTEKACCEAEWGLSILIESGGHKVLFDVGASDMFARNAANLGIDLGEVESVVISHGHYDHTTGMKYFFELNDKAWIYVHRKAFNGSFLMKEDGRLEDHDYGTPWQGDTVRKLIPRLEITHDVRKLNDCMTMVGDIPPLPEYPMAEKYFYLVREWNVIPPDANFYTDEKGVLWVQDQMKHEQFLAVSEGDGIYIFSGCCHVGVMAILARAKELFPDKKIRGLIAGMHLYAFPKEKQAEIVDSICALGLEWVFPVHCTGMDAVIMFKERLGDRCVIASAGQSYEL